MDDLLFEHTLNPPYFVVDALLEFAWRRTLENDDEGNKDDLVVSRTTLTTGSARYR